MKTILYKAKTRGHAKYDWLDSYHSFSFDTYYDPERMNFGALRVLNDDWIAPETGFGMHPHKNMEIVSIPIEGYLQHGDSKQNERTITAGDIQVMSAGTGIIHSERNNHASIPVISLQIWIMPKQRNTPPKYQDYDIRPLLKENELITIISPDGTTEASLQQDAWFSIGKIENGKKLSYKLHQENTGVFLFMIEGAAQVGENKLSRRDAIGIYQTDEIQLETLENSHILLIEVPM
ncbi:pirin family protein [uncultured Bacteroides sp.]|uniref:pirin family protein n=1 Tax=uncultured Bacteroides sp. TaxID=162156 RepID=UPI002AAB9638|nr:pirin family protein [uncultured Bacteroides sp.]